MQTPKCPRHKKMQSEVKLSSTDSEVSSFFNICLTITILHTVLSGPQNTLSSDSEISVDRLNSLILHCTLFSLLGSAMLKMTDNVTLTYKMHCQILSFLRCVCACAFMHMHVASHVHHLKEQDVKISQSCFLNVIQNDSFVKSLR